MLMRNGVCVCLRDREGEGEGGGERDRERERGREETELRNPKLEYSSWILISQGARGRDFRKESERCEAGDPHAAAGVTFFGRWWIVRVLACIVAEPHCPLSIVWCGGLWVCAMSRRGQCGLNVRRVSFGQGGRAPGKGWVAFIICSLCGGSSLSQKDSACLWVSCSQE